VILLALAVGPLWLWGAELPNPIATQWDLGGAPKNSMSLVGFGVLMAALTLPGALALLGAALAGDHAVTRSVRAALAGLGGSHAALFAAVTLQATLAQRGVARWADAPGPGVVELVLILGFSGAVGGALASLALGWPKDAPRGEGAGQGAPASLGLGPDEQALWVRRVSAPWLYGLAVVGLVLVGVGFATAEWALVFVGAPLIPISTGMATALVSVDQTGLWVRWGTLGLWRTGVALRDVVQAEAIDIRPLEWGGWGYRGSLRLMGRAAVVLRAGPGVRLELRGGRVLAVTVDDAETAAGLLNDLVARRSAP
jgi:hypothetical protein